MQRSLASLAASGRSEPLSPTDSTNNGAAALASLDAIRDALAELRQRADAADYARAADVVASAARCHACGVGKSAHVAAYAAALLSATGTPCSELDPLHAVHGDLGRVASGDVVIAISNSGETEELLACVAALGSRGAPLVAIVGARQSRLGQLADAVLDACVDREGGPLGLAPRASVAAQLAVVAALSAELQARNGQTAAEFAALHPAGALGQRAREGSEAC